MNTERVLAFCRLGLASVSLALALREWSSGVTATTLTAVFYLVFALAMLTWSRPSVIRKMLALAVDLAGFVWIPNLLSAPGLILATAWIVYLVSVAYLLHGRRAITLVGLAPMIFFVGFQPDGWGPMILVCFTSGTLGLMADWHRNSLERQLLQASRQAAVSREEAENARKEERESIAGDFHDGPLQAFLSVQIRLEVVRRLLLKNFDAGMKELVQLQQLVQSQIGELRSFLHSMQPAEVEASELIASLSRLSETFQKESGISVTFAGKGSLSGQQHTAVAMEILQMVREAFNNVRKHARATAVAVQVERSGESLNISVDDNGGGFPFGGRFDLEELELLRLGPRSIKRRVRSLGGDLTVESMPGRGSELRIRIPQ
jgi:signal transduction histidine kinase